MGNGRGAQKDPMAPQKDVGQKNPAVWIKAAAGEQVQGVLVHKQMEVHGPNVRAHVRVYLVTRLGPTGYGRQACRAGYSIEPLAGPSR